MRTKHFLMAMILPATFAACTSDEFEALDNNSQANRKEIGKVAFSFNNGQADTRWDASFMPQVSDVTGAALADTYIGEKPGIKPEDKWKENYTISNYIQTNYPYTFDGKAWTSEANLVEGNYLFYAPYGQSHQVRTAIKFETPVIQKLDVKDGVIVENSAMKNVAESAKTPFYMGYKFLDSSEDNTNISIEMRSLFSYPLFTLKNGSGAPITITRVLVEATDGDMAQSGLLDNTKIIKALRDTKAGAWGGSLATNMKGSQYTADLLSDAKNTNLLRVELPSEVTIAANGEVKFDVVMPAQQFATSKLKLYFVTKSGKAYTWTNSKSTITTVPGRRYPAEDYDLNGKLKTAAGQLLTKTIDKNDALVDAPYIITSKEELISAISGTPASTTALKLTIVGEVDFDADVLKAIAEKTSQTVSFIGGINLVGGAGLDIDQKVIFEKANVKSGSVTFNNAVLDATEVTVTKGATLTVTKIAAGFDGEIINEGALILDTKVAAVTNKGGTLTLGAKGGFSTLTTEGESEQTVTIKGEVAIDNDKLEGTWEVPAGAKLTLNNEATLPYGSKLTVKGTLAGDKLTVSGTMDVDGQCDAEIEVTGVYDADATKAKNAVLNCNNGSLFTGAITGEGTTANTPAQIMNVKDGVSFFATPTITNLTSVYTVVGNVADVAKVTIPTACNKVVVDGNLNLGANWALSTIKELVITGNIMTNGAQTITTAGTASTVTANNIYANANLTFTNTTELNVKGELRNSATLAAATVTKLSINKLNMAAATAAMTLTVAEDITLGEVISLADITITKEAALTLKGNVTLAEGKGIKLTEGNEVNIAGNVTLQGAGAGSTFTCSKASTLTVAKGNTLTIGDKMKVTGATGQALTFASEESKGMVVNNGDVNFATKAYDGTSEDLGKGWWSGKAAAID